MRGRREQSKSLLDSIITGYSVFIATIPSFVMAYILAYVFAAQLLAAARRGLGRCAIILPVVAHALPATGSGRTLGAAVPGRGDVG